MKIGPNKNQRVSQLEQAVLRMENQLENTIAVLDKAVFNSFQRIAQELEKQATVLCLLAKSVVSGLEREEYAALREYLSEVKGSEEGKGQGASQASEPAAVQARHGYESLPPASEEVPAVSGD